MKVLIIAGGHGTRLWPQSRRSRPKQLQPLLSEKSLLQETVERALGLGEPADIFVVVSDHFQLAAVQQQLPQIPPANIIREPIGKNTLAAITCGIAELVRRGFAEETAVILYADHAISNPELMYEAFRRGANFLKKYPDHLLILGVRPTYPEPGYGYIECGQEIVPGVNEVYAFREKPNQDTATEFIKGGRHLWNAGLFQWRVDTFADRLRSLSPEHAPILDATDEIELKQAYESAPPVAIDYIIFEKDDRLATLPVALEWRDIGHWAAVKKHLQLKSGDNVIRGDHLGIDTKDCLIINQSQRPIVTIGLTGYVVIDTGDALLICPTDRAQDVRKATDLLGDDIRYSDFI